MGLGFEIFGLDNKFGHLVERVLDYKEGEVEFEDWIERLGQVV